MTTSGFDIFKKSLEDYLQTIEFIYAGDVISSSEKTWTKKLKHLSYSPDFMKEVLVDIYNQSFQNLFNNSSEIVIHRERFTDIHNLIFDGFTNSRILFFSDNSNKNLNLGSPANLKSDVGIVPHYFIRKFKLMSAGIDVSCFYSPLIKDTEDDCHFYLVDRPIQSMVWSMQNMTYEMLRGFSSNSHTIKLPIYNCDFQSTRVRVINTQKLREEKINSILYDN